MVIDLRVMVIKVQLSPIVAKGPLDWFFLAVVAWPCVRRLDCKLKMPERKWPSVRWLTDLLIAYVPSIDCRFNKIIKFYISIVQF